MFSEFQFLFIILFLQFLNINCVDYCEVEKKYCNNKKHVACYKNNFKNFDDVEDITTEIDFIINWINIFRNDLANGLIPKTPAVSNMNIVRWDNELQMLAEKRLLFADDGCCYTPEDGTNTKYISFNDGNETTDTIKQFIQKKFNIYKDPEMKMIWNFLYDATASKIGCGYSKTESSEENTFNIECYTNEIDFKDIHNAYLKGNACTNCPKNSQCDKTYKGLCVVPEKLDTSLNSSTNVKDITNSKSSLNMIYHFIYIIIILIIVGLCVGYYFYNKRQRVYKTADLECQFSKDNKIIT